MSAEKDIATINQQESLLQFPSFAADTAWELGCILRQAAMSRGAGMTFEIQVAGRVLFYASTLDAPAGQADWIRRKRNTVMKFGKSSYRVGLDLADKTMEDRHALATADHAAHGGGFPILLRGTGCVGSVIASGLPQRQDHAVVVTALAQLLGVKAPELD